MINPLDGLTAEEPAALDEQPAMSAVELGWGQGARICRCRGDLGEPQHLAGRGSYQTVYDYQQDCRREDEYGVFDDWTDEQWDRLIDATIAWHDEKIEMEDPPGSGWWSTYILADHSGFCTIIPEGMEDDPDAVVDRFWDLVADIDNPA